jgi:hypothetical protein
MHILLNKTTYFLNNRLLNEIKVISKFKEGKDKNIGLCEVLFQLLFFLLLFLFFMVMLNLQFNSNKSNKKHTAIKHCIDLLNILNKGNVSCSPFLN